jgi:hypothetical protein
MRQAIETVRRNKEQYAEAEARARARHPVRPSYFDAFGDMAFAQMVEGPINAVQAVEMMVPPGMGVEQP